MILATEADFFGGYYTYYRNHSGYAKRANLFKYFPEPIIVLGCGFGFLVEELAKLSKITYGIDFSDYAIENRISDRITKLNAITAPLTTFRTVISEDLLPCLNNKEISELAKNCENSKAVIIHMVTINGTANLNYKSLSEWVSLTKQIVISMEGL